MFSPCSGLSYNPKTCRMGELGNTKLSVSVHVNVFEGVFLPELPQSLWKCMTTQKYSTSVTM